MDKNNSGDYKLNVYERKAEQMKEVCQIIKEKGFVPEALVHNEVSWFYENLGIDDIYFSMESSDNIASNIMELYGSKIQSYTKNKDVLDIDFEKTSESGAVIMCTSSPGVSAVNGPQHEKRISEQYLDNSVPTKAYRLESFRSTGTVSSSISSQLRCYFITECIYNNINPTKEQCKDIRLVSDVKFLEKATENTLHIYSKLMNNVLCRTGPVIEKFDIPGLRQKRLVIGYKQKSTQGIFASLSDLYHYYDLFSTRKFVENFSNGVTIISIYLNQLTNSKSLPIESTIDQILKEASLIYCIPTTPFQSFFQAVQETTYGYVGWIFCQHFLNRLGNEFRSLAHLLDKNNPIHTEVLTKIKKRLRQETFTREYILDIITQYTGLIKLLYVNFALIHYITPQNNTISPTLSYQRIQTHEDLSDDELAEKIKAETSNIHEYMVLHSFLIFNKHVLKTNFYQPTKVALSFRLDPAFIPSLEYPTKLYGMFFVIGSEFRGFHLRFRDIARGGIRVIKSRNREAYSINLRSLFDENYALAATQQKKNKDIPEGGSKGTILLDFAHQDASLIAFEKYVDSILDLLVVGQSPGIKEKIVDNYKKEEILFFGPDEGTADYMDWASSHARNRGAHFWKAFTTGKSQSLGGIPHDLFGMTTRSVHQYVIGIYKKMNLMEEESTKLQTGGPDGDLGSNEILISKDKTIGIVDGSGVLFDPLGIDRAELVRLAKKRAMISEFDTTKLGPKGYRVLVDQKKVRLPSGEIIADGLMFRNTFHLHSQSSADVFVPCGGRPESVDLDNYQKLLKPDGKPRFKYIVEGANLFFTQDARLRLERAGAMIFKDASANKGGVTSSSLEVLAALAFDDVEFKDNMQTQKDGTMPQFYNDYIKDVHRIIEKNAELEFECLWMEATRTNTPRCVLSDDLSFQIVKLNEDLQKTNLWLDVNLRNTVLEEAFPNLLLAKLGLATLIKRIPEPYVKAIFGSYLASRFIYKYGIQPSQFAFFEFMAPYFQKSNGNLSLNK